MTTAAPLDVDRRVHACTILVDLENVRLAWQQYYRHIFCYEDLVYLVLNAERNARARANKVMFFMTEPNEGLFRSKERQFREELRRMDPKSFEAHRKRCMIECLYAEHRAYVRLVRKLKEEEAKTASLDGNAQPADTAVSVEEWSGGIGGVGDGSSRLCKVEARLYDVKRWKGQTVQRGCDVALAAELTKACFNPNIDNVILFSGDSDFDSLVTNTLTPESVGGGVNKLAKNVWVMAFSASIVHYILRDVRACRLRQGIRYLLIDEDFAEIAVNFHSGKVKRTALPTGFYTSDAKNKNMPGKSLMFAFADERVNSKIKKDMKHTRERLVEEALSDVSSESLPSPKRQKAENTGEPKRPPKVAKAPKTITKRKRKQRHDVVVQLSDSEDVDSDVQVIER